MLMLMPMLPTISMSCINSHSLQQADMLPRRAAPLTATGRDLRCGRCLAGVLASVQVHRATQAAQTGSRHGWLPVRHPAALWTAWVRPRLAWRSASPACTRSSPPPPTSWMPTTMTPATAPLLCSCLPAFGARSCAAVVLHIFWTSSRRQTLVCKHFDSRSLLSSERDGDEMSC